MASERTRVTILGTGPAALATALHLTDPAHGDRFEVTMYQSGWRSGGLCAGGRVAPEWWVNQNCTHYLFGCYQQALFDLRTCVEELETDPDNPFGAFGEHIIARPLVVMMQQFQGQWTQWTMEFPSMTGPLGARPAPRGPVDVFRLAIHRVLGFLRSETFEAKVLGLDGNHGLLHRASQGAGLEAIQVGAAALMFEVDHSALASGSCLGKVERAALAGMVEVLRWAARRVLEPLAVDHLEALRMLILVDLALTMAIGMFTDDAINDDLVARLDDWDFSDWLRHHGALDGTVASPPIQLWYSAMAAYVDGDTNRPLCAAGASISCLGQIVCGYPADIAYQLRWEVADTFIAPMYATLARRGVKFAYFHRVWELLPDAQGRVGKVILERQAEVKGGHFAYKPLFVPAGQTRPLWPDVPDAAQLTHVYAADAQKYGEDRTAILDRFYCPRAGPDVELALGRDYDILVCGLSGPTLKWYTPALAAASPAWQGLLANLHGVESQGLRLWFLPTLNDMGWKLGPPITSALPLPYGTWEDPTPTLVVENWPDPPPQTISHLFGPLPFDPNWPEPSDWRRGLAYCDAQQTLAQTQGTSWLNDCTSIVWPGAATGTALDPSTCARPQAISRANGPGQIRANSGPDQAYYWLKPGAWKHRFPSGRAVLPGFFAVGDYTATSFPCGSVEGATISGRDAARAIIRG